MWSNNGFHGHGNFQQGQGSFQQGQGNFQQSYQDDGYIPFTPVTASQQYFQHQRPPQTIQYNEGTANIEQFAPGEFQPEVGLYEEGAFMQYLGVDGPEQYTPQRHYTNSNGTPRPTLNARAEELKAQLLKNKERAKSGTPPVTISGLGSKPSKITEGANSLQESPMTPGGSSDDPPAVSRRPSSVIDDDLNDLISEAKAAADIKKERTQSDTSVEKPHQSLKIDSEIKSRVQSTESSSKPAKQGLNTTSSEAKPGRKRLGRQESNGEMSDVSEGEIHEDPKAKTSHPSAGPKESHNTAKPNNEVEQVLGKPREGETGKTSHSYESPGTSPRRSGHVPNSRVSSRLHDERHEEAEGRLERKSYQSNNKYEHKHQPEPEQRSYQRRDTRDSIEDHRKHEVKYESRREEATPRKPEVPTLAQLLRIDEDLKEWLDVTGYHNAEYRNKILNRRRAIAALDAQKAKLLEEMEIEERGGLQSAASGTPAAGMLPPPIPSKMGAVASSVKKIDDIPVRIINERSSSVASSQEKEAGAKRTYTDYRGSRDEGVVEKVGRVNEQGRGVRIKADSQSDDRRPYSSGYDSSRHRSTSADEKAFRHEDRDSYGEGRGRDRGRAYSHQRDISPGSLAYESRPPARSKTYDFSTPEEPQDRNEWKGKFVQRGNYRGRAYDPNYRGRGRGRGTWNELGEGRFEQRQQQAQPYGQQRVAFMKPYKDPKPLDLGSKGDTRYFIVKSFNEENVVRCVEDSIWTTQIENGDIFKSAFLTSKNVILVFSVNQSRAFQGYARMENVPGSEESPQWQKSINWESAGAFRVKWLCVASTRFHRVGHLKNSLNENQPVLIGRDGQEIEEHCGKELLKLIDEEADRLLMRSYKDPVPTLWDD